MERTSAKTQGLHRQSTSVGHSQAQTIDLKKDHIQLRLSLLYKQQPKLNLTIQNLQKKTYMK